MFIYRLVKESYPENCEFCDFVVEETIKETTNKKEISEFFQEIQRLEEELKKNTDSTPLLGRKCIKCIDDKNLLFIEVEYYPLDKLLEQIEKETGRDFGVLREALKFKDLPKLYLKEYKDRLYLQMYNQSLKKNVNVANLKNEKHIRFLLQNLVSLWNDYRESLK
ncbi:hypothetical protein SAMN06269117_11437 [Balnearium lithotrophicum]|uniref:Uncharacterized protein n=1 Tax=Balnearium lithotrophicum TaxID=223788 RepID=A0A521CP61_9BACT|nr:hypothetical protein [Balnearium lithotrophicum]SMO61244.1 hypothetical protein SAMN06269117_11437 [Balnearium lithotrophicum]